MKLRFRLRPQTKTFLELRFPPRPEPKTFVKLFSRTTGNENLSKTAISITTLRRWSWFVPMFLYYKLTAARTTALTQNLCDLAVSTTSRPKTFVKLQFRPRPEPKTCVKLQFRHRLEPKTFIKQQCRLRPCEGGRGSCRCFFLINKQRHEPLP